MSKEERQDDLGHTQPKDGRAESTANSVPRAPASSPEPEDSETLRPTQISLSKQSQPKRPDDTDDKPPTQSVSFSSEDPKRLLAFLSSIDNFPLDISGFAAKDYFAELYPEKNVDKAYLQLKEAEYLYDRSDHESFRLTSTGQDEATTHQDLTEEIINEVVDRLFGNEGDEPLLRRLLWTAYTNYSRYNNQQLLKPAFGLLSQGQQLVVLFFSNKAFRNECPEVQQFIRTEVRISDPETAQWEFRALCRQPEVLRTATILRWEETFAVAGVETTESSHTKLSTILNYWLEPEAAAIGAYTVAWLGLAEGDNEYDIDVTAVFEEHKEQLKEWYEYQGTKLKQLVQTHWSLLLELRTLADGGSIESTELFAELGVLVPKASRLAVREEAADMWVQIADELESQIKDDTEGLSSVAVVPFLSRYSSDEIEADVIVSVHGKEYDVVNFFDDHTLVLLSPSEFGYKVSDRFKLKDKAYLERIDRTQVFDPLGRREYVGELESQFQTVGWEYVDSYDGTSFAERRLKRQTEEKLADPARSRADGLFMELFNLRGGTLPFSLSRDEPVVVLLHSNDDVSYETTLQICCRELYHQLKGGLPSGYVRGDRKEIERELAAESRIEFVDNSNSDFFKNTGDNDIITVDDVRWQTVRRRLRELYSQGFGFIIFQLPTSSTGQFESKLQEELGALSPQVVEVEPDHWTVTEEDRRLANALWGFPLADNGLEATTFDEQFGVCERAFKDTLRTDASRLLDDGDGKRSIPFVVNRSPTVADDPTSNETQVHYLLKAFVVRSLVETEGMALEKIQTEDETELARETDNAIIPDVQAGNAVYEVETLYGTGEPLTKLTETVKRYVDNGESPQVNLVVTGLTALLFEHELRRLVRDIDEEWSISVRVVAPSLREHDLVSLDELKLQLTDVEDT